MEMRCMICQQKEETKHLPLYVCGSEGLDICHSCEMALVSYIRESIRLAYKSRKLGYQTAKEVAKTKSRKNEPDYESENEEYGPELHGDF